MPYPSNKEMNIQLTRPFAVLDLETTGVNLAVDRIVEIAILKINPDGTRTVKRKLINPRDENTGGSICHSWHYR